MVKIRQDIFGSEGKLNRKSSENRGWRRSADLMVADRQASGTT